MTTLLLCLLLACSGSDENPTANEAPAPASQPEVPVRVSIASASDLAGFVRQHRVVVHGVVERYETPMWGGRHLAIQTEDRLIMLDVANDLAVRIGTELGKPVRLTGTLTAEPDRLFDLYTTPVQGDSPVAPSAPTTAIDLTLAVDDLLPPTAEPDLPSANNTLDLDAVFREHPVVVEGTLRYYDRLDGYHAPILELPHQTLVGVRVVVEVAEDLKRLDGKPVRIEGVISTAEDAGATVLTPDKRHVGFMVNAKRFE